MLKVPLLRLVVVVIVGSLTLIEAICLNNACIETMTDDSDNSTELCTLRLKGRRAGMCHSCETCTTEDQAAGFRTNCDHLDSSYTIGVCVPLYKIAYSGGRQGHLCANTSDVGDVCFQQNEWGEKGITLSCALSVDGAYCGTCDPCMVNDTLPGFITNCDDLNADFTFGNCTTLVEAAEKIRSGAQRSFRCDNHPLIILLLLAVPVMMAKWIW